MDDSNIPQKAPHVMTMEPGTYAWCACGQSENQPFCDGSHKGTEKRPIVEKLTESKKVAWCGCKQSGGAPYCDGTHAKI